HGVHDASLHGFEPVVDRRHRPFEDYVRCVIEKPVLVESFYGQSHFSVVGSSIRSVSIQFHVIHYSTPPFSNSISSATGSFSTRRFSRMKSCLSGVFFPM